MTAEAWGVSTDSGQTWNGGMTVDGDTIVRILNAVGVNADWVNTGAITVTDTDGSIIFSVDMDTKSVYLDGSVQIGGGKSLNQTFANYLQESKDYSDGKLSDYAETVTGSLGELQDQIDGQIETFYYDYEPTLQNKPASDWTNTTERKKHIGDLFFNKTTGYAYRFMQDGAVWGWILVQDTDITKAMQAAQNAQDTADHKRRVFVTTPEPPYDIGDLWSQDGGDILTCTTARAKGAKYVESDWEKLNKYTDDTTAEKALEAASLARNMTMQLDNDYQGIPVDSDGNYSTFPDCTTTATVMYGSQDITDDCTYTITKSENVQGRWKDDTHTYTVTALTADSGWVDIRAAYLNNLVISKRFSLAKQYAGKNGIDGLQGIQGEKGEQGIPGKDGTNGVDGKTSYFHIKYSSVSNPTSSSQMTETPSAYIGTYVDFTEVDSNDPKKYTWSKFEGKDGEDGIPGTNGADGKTYYLHIAYANSSDGKTDFSTSNSTNKSYIGQYTDATQSDSTDPTKYSWTKIKGETGAAGRTYFIELSSGAAKRGADGSISPSSVTAYAYYRDGTSSTRTAYSGRWKIQTSTDGNTWSDAWTSTSNSTSATRTLAKTDKYNFVRFVLYASGGTTNMLDMQTLVILTDVSALTQEEIVNILSNNGTWKGLYYINNQLYISFNAAKGGTLVLGGQNDGNGLMKIYDSSGSLILTVGKNGIETRATTLTDKNAKGKIAFNKKGLTFTEDIAGGGTGTGEDLHLEKSIISFDSLANIIGELDKLTVRKDAKIEGKLLFYDYENQAKRASGSSEAVTRQPIASITADGNRVAFLSSDYHKNGYGAGTEHSNYRLGVKAQWGGSSYDMHYIYTNLNISDIRLKENVKASETDALETVNRMKVRQFDWKKERGGWHQNIGFVADELEEIDPNLALGGGYDENGEIDIKQINSPYLLNYAIKAIQELSAKVDEQEKRIKELEMRLQDGKI